MRWWGIWLLWMLGLAGPLRAEQASLREFGPADGLDNLGVQAAVQDAEGFLWVGTENGLYRMDGARLRRMGMEHGLAWISALAVQDGGLWVGAFDGLWRWQRGQWVAVRGPDGQPLKVSGPDALAVGPDQSLWVAARNGLHRVTPTAGGTGWQAVRALPEDPQRPWLAKAQGAVEALADGTLWFACDTALCRLQQGRVVRFAAGQGVPAVHWDGVMAASGGSLWARGGRYLLELAPGADRFVQRGEAVLETDQAGIYPLAQDKQGRILTATRGGLLRWDGRHWERFGAASGLGFPGRLTTLLSDREGGLWLGASGAGLMQWRGYSSWESWSARDGLPSDVVWRFLRAGAGTAQPLYVGTGKGLAVLDASARRFRALPSNATGAVDVGALAMDAQGAVWAGTWGGQVVRYAGAPSASGRVTGTLQEGDVVYGLQPEAPEGPLIIGLDALYGWDAGRVRPLAEALVGKGSFGCSCRTRDGVLWVGGANGLLSPRQGRWLRFDSAGGLIEQMACLRDGSLLVSGGDDGIHQLHLDGDRFRRTQVTPPLLRGRQVLALLQDRRGWWWVSTDLGVAVFNGRHWRWLDPQAGLIWGDTSGGSLYEDVDGSVWIGTSRGASHMLSPETLFEPVRGRVALEEVRSGESVWPVQAEATLTLPWSHDVIEVPLAAPVFRQRSALRIEYRVLGFDERWMAAPPQAVRLTGLPPGSYRFEARVIDQELGVESPASGFGFDIEPPWWRSPPAYGAAGFGLLMAGWLVHRWRVRRVTRHAALMEALVRQRTLELEASRQELQELATRDGLTGAWNRRAVMEILQRELGRAQRERAPLTLVLADIDHFKRVNDSLGHPAGDAVLREFVKRLTAVVRPYDAVGRFGGEEFLIVLPGLNPTLPGDGQRVQAIHAVIASQPMPPAGRVTCSFGVATLAPGMEADADQLIAMADQALYRAKRDGRDRVVRA